MNAQEDTKAAANSFGGDSGIELAARLLWLDRYYLLLLELLLTGPFLVITLFATWQESAAMAIELVQRSLEMVLLYLVCRRVLRRLGAPQPASWRAFLSMLAGGFAVWSALTLPALLILSQPESARAAAGALLLLGGAAMVFCYFFYFMPIACGERRPAEILRQARTLTREHPVLPFQALVAPLLIWLVLHQLALVPAPDGRTTLVTALRISASGSFWIVSTYLSIGLALAAAAPAWRSRCGLAAETEVLLQTAGPASPLWLRRLIAPTQIVPLLLVGSLLFLANEARLAATPPAPAIQVRSITVTGSQLRLRLALDDPRYHFRGFSLRNFALAGLQRNPASTMADAPTDAQISAPEPARSRQTIIGMDNAEVELTFKTNRRPESFQGLTDLNLWYLQTRVTGLTMSTAVTTPSTD
jgi:hypothetical protein